MIRLCLSFLFLFFFSPHSFAQSDKKDELKTTLTGPGVTGTLSPIGENSRLTLITEAVQIFLREDWVSIEAEYELANQTEQTITQVFGFPILKADEKPFLYPKMNAFQDKKLLSLTPQKTPMKSKFSYKAYMPFVDTFNLANHWQVAKITVAAKSKTKLQLEYDIPYLSKKDAYRGRVEQSPRLFRFVRSEGRPWPNKAPQSTFYVVPAMEQPQNLYLAPPPDKKEDQRFIYQFDDQNQQLPIDVTAFYNPLNLKITEFGFKKLRRPRTKVDSYYNYAYANLIDGLHDTNWCEGEKGDGRKMGIEIEWGKDEEISALHIFPGHGPEKETFYERNRVKKFRYYLIKLGWTSELSKPIRLKDSPVMQRIPIETDVKANAIGIQVLEVYSGSEYNDTCLAEIQVERKK